MLKAKPTYRAPTCASYNFARYVDTATEDRSFFDSRIEDSYRNTDHGGEYA